MDLAEAIKNRRSIRKYQSKKTPYQAVRAILEAGLDAPSAGNLQSRRFYIVTDAAQRRELAQAAFEQDFISEVSVAIVVCADHRIESEYGARGVELYSIMDCSAAVQNMLLMAHALELGACWVSAFREEEVARILDLPDHLRPVAIVPVGYAAESPAPGKRISFEEGCRFL